MCRRPFRNDSERQSFKNRLETLVKTTKNTEDENLQGLQEDLDNARAASTSYDTWVRLSQTDVPDLEKEEEQHDSQRDQLLANMENHDKV
ncbi:DNA repair protein Rad50, partial [Aspergillus sclerotialis]